MNIIHSITDYISPLYNQKAKDIFSRIPLDKYQKILNMYTNQQNCNIDEYIVMRLENTNDNVEVINNYITYSDKDTYQVIYYDTQDNTYLFQAYAFKHIFELIIINSNRYVFIPLMFSKKDSKIGHAVMLIIDKKMLSIRVFDSNGLTLGDINHIIIDKFMKTYFEIFNITFNENYTYLEQKKMD